MSFLHTKPIYIYPFTYIHPPTPSLPYPPIPHFLLCPHRICNADSPVFQLGSGGWLVGRGRVWGGLGAWGWGWGSRWGGLACICVRASPHLPYPGPHTTHLPPSLCTRLSLTCLSCSCHRRQTKLRSQMLAYALATKPSSELKLRLMAADEMRMNVCACA